jgi:RNA polymerase sigma-70 factor (ECF subfamily)
VTLERLYLEHGHVVLRRARQLLGDEDEARDVLQELFTTLAQRRGLFAGRSGVTTWLYAATTNICLSRIRNRRTRARLLDARGVGMGSTVEPLGETRALALDLLAELDPELATVAVYYYADEMTQEEIAEVLSCSRRRVGDLVQKLRGVLEKRWRAA